ncbi:MAG: YidC/Oxa1 family membrane protein insertase [Clostridia bacterium]|nr:YidC/Oxa1 family membrane protein insertase [Clostridia bacterium]
MWQYLVNLVADLIRVLYEFTVSLGIPSYALAILLMTLFIRLILYPLNNKQLVSSKKMQEIQPQIAEIQKKYKKSPEIANQEIIKLYRKHNVNPMSGCLPILVQMPIIIALFQALRLFEYTNVGAAFFWVPHLKDPDPYFILPLLVGIATYLQTKLSMMSMPKTTQSNPQAEKFASTQKTMLYVMPIMIGWMSTQFPSGLCLYWIFYSLTGIIQQMFVNRRPTLQEGKVGGANE